MLATQAPRQPSMARLPGPRMPIFLGILHPVLLSKRHCVKYLQSSYTGKYPQKVTSTAHVLESPAEIETAFLPEPRSTTPSLSPINPDSGSGFGFWGWKLGFRVRGLGVRDTNAVAAIRLVAVPAFRFRISGFGFQVSGFRFRVSGLGFEVLDFGFRVSGFGFRVSGFGFRVSGFGFRVSGFGFWVFGHRTCFPVSGFWVRISGVGLRISGCRCRVSGFGFWISGFGFRVSGSKFQVSVFRFRTRAARSHSDPST